VPQLLMVPRQSLPEVENFVFISALPRATPLTCMGVSGVMRRLKLEALS
jgi:hypothetical protein